jgi:rod shape determining protein RodA
MVDYASSRPVAGARSGADLLAFLRRLDVILLGAVVAVVAYGIWGVAGITKYDVAGDEGYYVTRQLIAAGLGFAGLLVALAIDPDRFRRAQRLLYVATIGLMLLVIPFAQETRGSRRWIDLGPFQFQPSEFGKLLFVLALAGFLVDRVRRLHRPTVVLQAVGLGVIPIALVFRQPDLGTALVYVAALFACLFLAGVRWPHVIALLLVGATFAASVLVLLPRVGVELLEPYQIDRLTGFTNPDLDPAGTTYNVNQSMTAIGAGGFDGRGVDGATQTRLDYLPEHATDFVFASFAEQRGFVGAALLLGLYLLIVWRALRVVTISRDLFGAVVAGGIAVTFLFQVFVNVGMTMGMAPVTGIPLPFVTVGGSSMVVNLVAMGVLLSIHARGAGGKRRPV